MQTRQRRSEVVFAGVRCPLPHDSSLDTQHGARAPWALSWGFAVAEACHVLHFGESTERESWLSLARRLSCVLPSSVIVIHGIWAHR